MKSPTELTELFRERGLKVTPQRRAIFDVLHGNPEHPTAEGIYARVSESMPTISLRTVYQVLNDLSDMGELAQLDLGTGSSRFDPNLDPHHHLVCESCGTVLDVHGDFPDRSASPPQPQRGSRCPPRRSSSGGSARRAGRRPGATSADHPPHRRSPNA